MKHKLWSWPHVFYMENQENTTVCSDVTLSRAMNSHLSHHWSVKPLIWALRLMVPSWSFPAKDINEENNEDIIFFKARQRTFKNLKWTNVLEKKLNG